MTGHTHQSAGITSLWLLTLVPGALTTSTIGLAVLAASFGALFPDLDSQQNRLRDMRVGGISPFSIPSFIINKSAGHRGLLHSFVGLFCVASLFFPAVPYTGLVPWLAFILGYLSHLFLDCCTVQGLRLMWPSKKSYWMLPKRARIVTGKEWEPVYFMSFLCADLVLVMYLLMKM